MNFWQRLRLLGTVAVLAISLVALVIAVLRTPDSDAESDAPAARPARALKPQSGTTGL